MNPQDEKWASLCPRCLKEVSNKAYFAGPKGSAHFRGTCEPPTFYPKVIPERTVDKPMPYPMPPMPNYNATTCPPGRHWEHVASCYVFPRIETYCDLAKWWGLPMIGEENGNGQKSKETVNQWIAAHPEIAVANKASVKAKNTMARAAKTLARMGVGT